MHSRGKPEGHNWQTSGGAPGTIDDISVFVIPLVTYKKDWEAWKKMNDELRQNQSTKVSPGNNSGKMSAPVKPQSVSQPAISKDMIQTSSVQNGLVPPVLPVEVLATNVDDIETSQLPIAEISLDAEEVLVPEDVSERNGGDGEVNSCER